MCKMMDGCGIGNIINNSSGYKFTNEKKEEYYPYYEINVSQNGKHLFATHQRSLNVKNETLKLVGLFLKKFPLEEGYKVDVTGMVEYGRVLEVEKINS